MNKIISFGEALIDFVPTVNGLSLAQVEVFRRAPGGAPANVAAGLARLGGHSCFAGKVGADAFGDFLRTTLAAEGVDTRYLLTTDQAKTALAFVSLRADGERDFLFYREPSADMLIAPAELEADWFRETAVFHFGSITLTWPVSEAATLAGVQLARQAGTVISFDPNLRFSLWPSPETAREKILPLLPMADLLKVGEEELAFLMETGDEEQAVARVLEQGVSLLVVTRGREGCSYYTPRLCGRVGVKAVAAVDTTGAGDAFVAGLLYRLAEQGLDRTTLPQLLGQRETLESILGFANACGAITTQGRGAIPSLPTREQVQRFMSQ